MRGGRGGAGWGIQSTACSCWLQLVCAYSPESCQVIALYPVLWLGQVRAPGLQLGHVLALRPLRLGSRGQFPKVSTLQVTGASLGDSPLTNMNLKPRWGSVAQTQVLSMRGAQPQPLSLCPSSHWGLRHKGQTQPRGPCCLSCWQW